MGNPVWSLVPLIGWDILNFSNLAVWNFMKLVQMNICGKVLIKWKSNMVTTRIWDIFFFKFIPFCSYFLRRDLWPMGLLFNKCITTHCKDHSYEVSLQLDQTNSFPIVNLQIFRPLKTCRKELQYKISNLYAQLPPRSSDLWFLRTAVDNFLRYRKKE
jgi:hypothetical protein